MATEKIKTVTFGIFSYLLQRQIKPRAHNYHPLLIRTITYWASTDSACWFNFNLHVVYLFLFRVNLILLKLVTYAVKPPSEY